MNLSMLQAIKLGVGIALGTLLVSIVISGLSELIMYFLSTGTPV